MKPSLFNLIVCLVVSTPACVWAADLKCVWDGKNPDARMAQQYTISVEEDGPEGLLLSVNGKEALMINEHKYRAGGKTFWYDPVDKRLTRYDAATGSVDYLCK
jgi:hypothetical protein